MGLKFLFYLLFTGICEVHNYNETLVRSALLNSCLCEFKESHCEVISERNISVDEFILSVNYTNNDLIYNKRKFKYGTYCINETSVRNTYVLRLCYEIGYCLKENNLMCLKKCCKHGEILKKNHSGKVECTGSLKNNLNITSYNDSIVKHTNTDVFLFHQPLNCPKYIANYTKHKFYFVQNGSMFIEEKEIVNEYTVNQEKYCLENYRGRDEVFICAHSNKNHSKFTYSRPIMIFSCFCLLLAMLRFIFCFKTMKLMQWMLISLCSSEFVSFAIITYLQFGFLTPNRNGCLFAGFFQLFAALTSFLWLNVISYSVWKTLRSMTSKNNDENSVYRTFFLYACYVWSVASIITSICYIDNVHNILPNKFHPVLGKTKCILEHSFTEINYGYIIYFTIPISAILVSNMAFFAYTIGYFVNVKMNIIKSSRKRNGIQSQLDVLNNTFKMALKLFIIMGCTWLFEVISTLYDFKQSQILEKIEFILDAINSLHGFLLLLIFDYKGIVKLFSFCKIKRTKSFTPETLNSH